MEPASPATPPATNAKQDQPSPTQAAVVASLLLLKEAAGPDENFDLDKENYLVPDESTVEVHDQPPVTLSQYILRTVLFVPVVQENPRSIRFLGRSVDLEFN